MPPSAAVPNLPPGIGPDSDLGTAAAMGPGLSPLRGDSRGAPPGLAAGAGATGGEGGFGGRGGYGGQQGGRGERGMGRGAGQRGRGIAGEAEGRLHFARCARASETCIVKPCSAASSGPCLLL